MLHTKFRGNRSTGSEKIFEGVLPYIGVAAIVQSYDPDAANKLSFSLSIVDPRKIWL